MRVLQGFFFNVSPGLKLHARSLRRKLSTFQVIILGYAFITMVGTVLLTLPRATVDGLGQSLSDALFIATSAISTTGLVVVDPGTYYTLFGQIVVIGIVQIGGLGYMIFIALIGFLLHNDPSLNVRKLLQDSLAGTQLSQLKHFIKLTLIYTFALELVGGILLSFFWLPEYSISRALYYGVFHSISAFCTAGFSLFSDSMMPLRDNVEFNLIMDSLCLIGGIGFFVIYDIHGFLKKVSRKIKPRRLSFHSRVILRATFIVISAGFVLLLLTHNEFSTLPSFKSRILAASYQVISASTTTGFNSIDIGGMQMSSLLLICILMVIGASPGSTGGGIKTSTLAVIWISLKTVLKGEKRPHLFYRKISQGVMITAFTILVIAIGLIVISLLILLQTQNIPLRDLFFETVSAFGNVGLSTGITSTLNSAGKYIIILLMFTGRIGIMTVGYSLVGKNKILDIDYPEDDLYIG